MSKEWYVMSTTFKVKSTSYVYTDIKSENYDYSLAENVRKIEVVNRILAVHISVLTAIKSSVESIEDDEYLKMLWEDTFSYINGKGDSIFTSLIANAEKKVFTKDDLEKSKRILNAYLEITERKYKDKVMTKRRIERTLVWCREVPKSLENDLLFNKLNDPHKYIIPHDGKKWSANRKLSIA